MRARIGDGPAFLSFDIDVLDPAFAPGDRHARGGGAATRARRSRSCARCAGIAFTGFDLVEVSPAYDTPGQTTALLGATVAYEMLALRAVARR